MKRCKHCNTSKLFLKLKNDLCPECSSKYEFYAKKYKEILAEINSSDANFYKIQNSISVLRDGLKDFDHVDNKNLLKSNICDSLLIFAKTNIQTSLKEDYKEEKFIEENGSPIIVVPEESTPEITSEITPTITENFYNEAKEIVHKLSDDSLSISEMCRYTFLLKNNYMCNLKQNNITEISEFNLEKLINTNLKKASITLSCPVDSLYSFFNYVAFSIQTTGLKIRSNDILEISAIKSSFGSVIDTFNTLVNPLKSISLSTTKRTNISNEDVKNSPSIEKALNDFLSFSDGLTLVSHNSNLNYGFIDYAYTIRNNKPLNKKTICSMKLYRTRYNHFHGEPPKIFSLDACTKDILTCEEIDEIENMTSIAQSCAMATYKIYEILKYKYK